jgi:uncharacterized membrane protein
MTETKQPIINKRPELLKVLCILTFIGSGFSAISNISVFLLIDVIREMYSNGGFDMWLNEESRKAFEMMISADRYFFLVQALVYLLAIFGAYYMWNFKKLGFHLYTVAQILLVITAQVFIPGLPFPFFEVMLSLVFISFYARFLKIMN